MEPETSWPSNSGLSMSSKPRNRANLSAVWRYFTRIGDARSCLGSCLFCGTEVAVPGGSTTGMFSHLSVHHPEAYREAKDQQLCFKPRADLLENPIDLSARILHQQRVIPSVINSPGPVSLPPPVVPEISSRSIFPAPVSQVVRVKPLEPRHVPLSVFPYLYHSYLKMSSGVSHMEDNLPYDLVIHCKQGVVVANKLLFAAVSHFARELLENCGQQVSQLVLADIEVNSMKTFVKSIYHGTLDFKDESLHAIFNLFGIPYNFKTPSQETDNFDDIGEDSDDDSFIEPVLKLDIGKTAVNLGNNEVGDEATVSGSGQHLEALVAASVASESEIEAKAQELKDRIFAECGLVPKKGGRVIRNTRNPSKIWKWFTKTPTYIYCKICGLGIKNSGNTTNASSHLKRHPEHYAEFKVESAAQMVEINSEAAESLEPNVEEEYDRMVWRYFQISKKSNRKAKCYLCGKDTPMGSNNVLVHLRHHHPVEHARIVDMLARRQIGAGGSKQQPAANVTIKSEPETEHVKIKVEVDEDPK